MDSPDPLVDRIKKKFTKFTKSLSRSRKSSSSSSMRATRSLAPSPVPSPRPSLSSGRWVQSTASSLAAVGVPTFSIAQMTPPAAAVDVIQPITGSASQSSPTAAVLPSDPPQPRAPDNRVHESRNVNVEKGIAIFRTLLNISEKLLEGVPIWGVKAGIATTSEVLKSVQVRNLKEA
jgi:hypothetical protein